MVMNHPVMNCPILVEESRLTATLVVIPESPDRSV